MKVHVLPADTAGCGSYRLIWAAQHLQTLGHDITIEMPHKESGLQIFMKNEVITDIVVPDGVDVIVFQRIAHHLHTQALPLLRERGIAVVIDMDDDLTAIHRENKAWANYHPKSNSPFSWKNAEIACAQAAMVTVSTKSLLKVYARHGRGYIIDNYVPESYLKIDVPQDDVFGWAGTTQSHPTDLQVTGKAVQELIDAGLKFRLVGPPSGVQHALRLKQEPDHTGIIAMDDWAYEVARLKVAMAPLEPSPFNTSKSRLKLAEASAVGIPWVASPREEYRRFFRESGAGVLVDRPKDWYKELKRLMEDEALRKELGERGREFMRDQTIEANSWRWWEAWTKAYENQRGLKGSGS